MRRVASTCSRCRCTTASSAGPVRSRPPAKAAARSGGTTSPCRVRSSIPTERPPTAAAAACIRVASCDWRAPASPTTTPRPWAAAAPGSHGCAQGAGLAINGNVRIDSSIISGNTCNGAPSDLGEDSNTGTSIPGANNLIGHSDIQVPPDTIFANDPRLGALANNGGATQTHAVLADSPALDAGNNASGFQSDQRGNGFPRVKGAAADIG